MGGLKEPPLPTQIPQVVTADIQAGIESYISEQVRLGKGYFNLPFNGKELRLKLVRVHTEYLANLGPRSHFACVDLADVEGDLYDVDFFLSGDPGFMTVTETSVHKINGQPYYTWEQKSDKTWHRIAVADASRKLMGVLENRDEFDFIYRFTLPEINQSSRMWIPIPSSDDFQKIEMKSIHLPGAHRVLRDRKFGNQVYLVHLDSKDSKEIVELIFHVTRIEKSAYSDSPDQSRKYLEPDRLTPVNENFKQIALSIVKDKKETLVQARSLYDHVIDSMKYIRYGNGWGQGNAVYACNVKTGNCTDFHSYFIALARSIGIPARFSIGFSIPSERNDGGIQGYHCWAEFYAEGQWWPVDISEADKYSALSSYYFGRHPANRIEFSRGRDIILKPGPRSSPINFLIYPILEVGEKPVEIKAQFSFLRYLPDDIKREESIKKTA